MALTSDIVDFVPSGSTLPNLTGWFQGQNVSGAKTSPSQINPNEVRESQAAAITSLRGALNQLKDALEVQRERAARAEQALAARDEADALILGGTSVNDLLIDDLRKELGRSEAETQEAANQLAAKAAEATKLQERLDDAQASAATAQQAHEAEVKKLKTQVEEAETQRQTAETTAAEFAVANAHDLNAALQSLTTLQKELDQAKTDLDQAKSTEKQCTAELKEAREKLAQQETELEQMAVHRNGFTESTNAMHRQLTDQKTRNGELSGEVDALRDVNQSLKEQRALFIQALSGLGLGAVKEAVLSGDISKLAAATPQDGAATGEAMETDRDAGARALACLGAPPSGAEEGCRACKEPSRREKHTCGRQRNAPAPVGERPSKAAKTSANPKVERATMPSAHTLKLYLDGLLMAFGAVDADFQDKLDKLRCIGLLPAKSSPGKPSTLTLGHFDEILKLDGHDDRRQQPDGTFMTPREMLLAHVKQSLETNANSVYQELFRWLANEKFHGTRRHKLPQWRLQLDKTIMPIVLALDPTRHAEMVRDMSDDDE